MLFSLAPYHADLVRILMCDFGIALASHLFLPWPAIFYYFTCLVFWFFKYIYWVIMSKFHTLINIADIIFVTIVNQWNIDSQKNATIAPPCSSNFPPLSISLSTSIIPPFLSQAASKMQLFSHSIDSSTGRPYSHGKIVPLKSSIWGREGANWIHVGLWNKR